MEGFKFIGLDKAPGVDGYNATYFKEAWPVIQVDVIAVVKDFVATCTMYRLVKCTTITLVPKTAQPVTITEYTPISCCSI